MPRITKNPCEMYPVVMPDCIDDVLRLPTAQQVGLTTPAKRCHEHESRWSQVSASASALRKLEWDAVDGQNFLARTLPRICRLRTYVLKVNRLHIFKFWLLHASPLPQSPPRSQVVGSQRACASPLSQGGVQSIILHSRKSFKSSS